MVDTKLIIIDGMTGAGKSTTAHYIARQLLKNGLKVKWYHEEEHEHPLACKPLDEKLSDDEKEKLFVSEYLENWKKFTDEVLQGNEIIIIESYLLQYTIIPLIRYEWSVDKIAQFVLNLLEITTPLNPVVVSYFNKDVKRALNLNWERRGEDWKKWYIERVSKSKYATSRNISGEEAAYQIWQKFMDVNIRLKEEIKLRSIFIDNGKQNWKEIRSEIANFLQFLEYEELLYSEDYKLLTGNYIFTYDNEEHGKGEMIYKIYIHEKRLCIDAFWLGMKFIEVERNVFEIEGFPFRFKFVHNENNQVVCLEVVYSSFYLEKGMKFIKK
ncbi:MAG: hypothetical protein JXR48_05215 [Candidatus Delongbacteria bacterium]|nr:hypothetical protein [Candidatus Delongbacteria bacterium]